MDVNYLGYAAASNQLGDRSAGLASLGNTLDSLQDRQMQRTQMARQLANDQRQNSLADLQMRSKEMDLAKDRANSLAMINQYGTGDRPDFQTQLADATAFKGQEDRDLLTKEAARKNALEKVKTFTDTFKSFADAVHNDTMDPDAATKAFPGLMKHLGIDYSNAGISFTFGKGGSYYSGPIKETDLIRVNGKETPYGSAGIVEKARVVGIAQDGKTPIYEIGKDTTFKEMKPDAEALLDKRLAAQEANTNRQIEAADRRAERKVATGDKTDPIVAREAVKDLPKLRREAKMAEASKARLSQMIGLIDKGSAGGLKGTVLTSVAGIFDTPATSEADLFKKLASAGAGQLRSAVIGPGQVSNYEQKLLQSVSGGGSGARTAVRELLKFYQQEADRTISGYDDAVESAALVAPNVSKAFKKIGASQPPPAQNAPKVGTVQDGYVFKGGNPADPKSWAKRGK